MTRRHSGGERGGATIELTLLTPLLILMLLMVVSFGRIAYARGAVDGAARDAARAASLHRDAPSAVAAARSAADASLQTGKASCVSHDVSVDTASFRAGGVVAVDVTCTASLGDLALLRIPGTKTITAHSVAVIDTYRSVTQ